MMVLFAALWPQIMMNFWWSVLTSERRSAVIIQFPKRGDDE